MTLKVSKEKKKLLFTRATFFKTLVFFSIFTLILLFFLHRQPELLNAQKNIKGAYADSSAIPVIQSLEKFILFENIKRLEEFGKSAEKSKLSDKYLEKFLLRYDNIISITAWQSNVQWPVRYVKPDFWKRNDVSNLTESEKQKLFKFIFVKHYGIENNSTKWYIGETWKNKNIILISIGYIYTKGKTIKVAEIKVEPYFKNLISGLFGKKCKVYILDKSENCIFSSGKKYNSKILTSPDFKKILLPQIGWTVISGNKNSGVAFTEELKSYFRIISVLALIFLFSTILSIFIDKPLLFISEKVTSVARGDFTTVIPPQSNSHADKIGRIFNYMAGEMERVKKINLGHIINEKNKTDAIIEHIADGVIVTNLADRIIRVNHLAESWFGLDDKKDNNRLIDDVIKDKKLKNLLKDIKEGSPHGVCEFVFEPESQTAKRIFQAHSSRVTDDENKLVNIVTVIRDITRIKEADRVKNELVSMVAHELKSPLSSIYGFSELLMDSKIQDPQAAEYIKVILSEATRLTDLINRFLDISRLESGRTQINILPFKVKTVIVKAIDTFKNQLSKKKISVAVDIEKNLPYAIGDQDMIEQVLVNLLSNAIKYSPEKSKIGIEVKSDSQNISLSVIDNGFGIPNESIGRIFDKFYRVSDMETDNAQEGTGLGLALCQEIVNKHGGTITVKSKFGVGSVFNFRIPAEEK